MIIQKREQLHGHEKMITQYVISDHNNQSSFISDQQRVRKVRLEHKRSTLQLVGINELLIVFHARVVIECPILRSS